MESVQGTIIDNNGTVLADTTIHIEHFPEGKGILGDWHGTCDIPRKHQVSIGSYRLRLNDGRSGDIFVTSLEISSNNCETVAFEGSGQLQ